MAEAPVNERVSRFYESIRGKRVAFLGVGVSHIPLIRQFAEKGAKVTACDRRTAQQLGDLARDFEARGVALQLGDDYLENLNFDIIFRTPGMKYTLPQLTEARRRGAAVTSEMELFFDLCPCKIIAVTGSDGKTTTTSIIAEMLKKEGFAVHLGGNIGHPLLPEIESVSPGDIAVVELSSFQLISMRRSPDIAVVTNLSPNHLDMHKDMEEYITAKKNIFAHQNAFGRTVLNLDNAITASFAAETRGQCLMFSRKEAPEFGAFLREDGMLCESGMAGVCEVMPAGEIKIPGWHNIENYLAALCAVRGLVSIENFRSVAREFPGVAHRREFVRELRGVSYYNDSIATSPTRTMAGLDAFDRKVILIAGGYDKHIPFEVLGPKVLEKVKTLILTGKTADKIEQAVRSAPGFEQSGLIILKADNLEGAVEAAHAQATAGDIVTLSPACASFDSFKNFEERGDRFKALVNALQ